MRHLRPIVTFLGSLRIAVLLLAVLAAVLAVSTTFESRYGTLRAQEVFYHTAWFDLILAAFAVNLFCAVLTRLPFRKHHTAFLMTHAGIIVLLAGALWGRLQGIEGRLTLAEGETRGELEQSSYQLQLAEADGASLLFPADRLTAGQVLYRWPDGRTIEVAEYLKTAELAIGVLEQPGGALNYAAQVRVRSVSLGIDSSRWLVEDGPDFGPPSLFALGGALVVLERRRPDVLPQSSPTLRFLGGPTGASFDAAEDLNGRALPGTPYHLERYRYLPNAKVSGSELVDDPAAPLNPAVEFDLVDAAGRREQHTKFALFPDFDSLHGGRARRLFPLRVVLLPPSAAALDAPRLTLTGSEDGWSYELAGENPSRGALKRGTVITTGWTDIEIEVLQILPRALVLRQAFETPAGRPALAVRIEGVTRWITREPEIAENPNGTLRLSLAPASHPLPFTLTLQDFRKVDYPGTSRAAAYESDVVLEDHAAGLQLARRISMNQPLDYQGYRIFQSSYAQDPSSGDISIFTVARNPGIPLIYGGSALLFLGVALLFYARPLSSLGRRIQG